MIYLLSDIANFARPKGAKDKGQRRRRLVRNVAIGAGVIGGTALAGRALTGKIFDAKMNPLLKNLDRDVNDILRTPGLSKSFAESIKKDSDAAVNIVRNKRREYLNSGTAAGGILGTGIVAKAYLANRNKNKENNRV